MFLYNPVPKCEETSQFFTSRPVLCPHNSAPRLQMQDGTCKLERKSKRNSSTNLNETFLLL